MFVTNVPTRLRLLKKGQSCWARSLNIEGTDSTALVENNGGNLWVMGTKSEGKGVRFLTRDEGVTEIYGAYEYTTHPIEEEDRRPMFWSEDSDFFAAGVFEVCFVGKPYAVKFRDTRDGKSLELDRLRIFKEKPAWSVMSARQQ